MNRFRNILILQGLLIVFIVGVFAFLGAKLSNEVDEKGGLQCVVASIWNKSIKPDGCK